MIDPFTLAQTHPSLETHTPVQTHTMLEKTPVVQGHLARDMLQLPAQGGEANQAAGVGIHRQAAAQLVGGQRPGPADPELGLLAPSAEGVDLLQFRDVFLLDGRAQAA